MQTQALLINTWHQRSKDPKQVWRCSIRGPGGQSVIGRSDNELGAIRDALTELRDDADMVMPRDYAVNSAPSIREAPRQSLEAVQYEYRQEN